MAKLKYYALCSGNMIAMKRQAARIPSEDLVIVFNSTNLDFVMQGRAWCYSQGIEHYVTESDGTPATGKNSVFDLFLASDNDYAVLVDGDDFVTPHGLNVYEQIAQMETPPDAVALVNQFGLVPNDGLSRTMFFLGAGGVGESEKHAADNENPDHIHSSAIRAFRNTDDWWTAALAGNLIEHWDEFTQDLSDAHQKMHTYAYNSLNQKETHLRVTFYSKAGAAYRFDPDLLVGEDTLHYYDLKHAWVNGEINLCHLDETYPSYVYDQRVGGIVSWANEQNSGRGWLEWMTRLNTALDNRAEAGEMHTQQPPLVDLVFDEDYRPDTLGLISYPCRRGR